MGVRVIAATGRIALAACALAAAFLVLTAAAARAQQDAIEVSVPAPTGPFEVGTRELELVDRSRVDTPGSPGSRRLMVQVTYPRAAAGDGDCAPSRYISPMVQPILMRSVAVYRDVRIATQICRGGQVAGGKRPVLVFSHAYTADRFVYATLVNDLASRGYIVLAPDHPPDAFAIQYPGGRLVHGEYGRPLASRQITAEELGVLNELRAKDASFVLSKTLALGARRSGFLAGRLDHGRVGVLGHSLGGSTAGQAELLDPRFDAAVDIDGSLFGDWVENTGSKTPFMLLAAEGGVGAFFYGQPICHYMAALRGPRFAFVLGGAMHFSYSDVQALAPQFARADPLWPFALIYPAVAGTIDPEVSVSSQRQALAAFFARYVKDRRGAGDPSPVGGFSELPIEDC